MINNKQIELLTNRIYTLDNSIEELELLFGAEIPSIFKCIMQNIDGFMSNNGISFYRKDDVYERNMTWEVSIYASGYIAIGDDGGGNIFMMKQLNDAESVYMTNAGTMDMTTARFITNNISEWILDDLKVDEDEFPDFCHIEIIRMPENGLKGLLEFKKMFCPTMSSAELLNATKQLPWRCASDYPYWKAKKQLEKLGAINKCIKLIT